MEDPSVVKMGHIYELYKHMLTKSYHCKATDVDPMDEKILDKCITLWKLDYECEILDNRNSEVNKGLCYTYPSRILIPMAELKKNVGTTEIEEPKKSILLNAINKAIDDRAESSANLGSLSVESCSDLLKERDLLNVPFFRSTKTSNDIASDGGGNEGAEELNVNDVNYSYRKYASFCNNARCWYRFVVPTIFANGKHICRSATLSQAFDMYGKQLLYQESPMDKEPLPVTRWETIKTVSSRIASNYRSCDIRLLKTIGVSAIMDLMVENKKIKYKVPISSSEKVDAEKRYEDFHINVIPYPGCEYFKEFTNNNLHSDNLKPYNWASSQNNAELKVPKTNVSSKMNIEWENYKEWDLRTMTSQYLRLMLKYILDEDSEETGLLVHCISGWDRTPLFISLLRLSLWADGKAHRSLSAKQMLFFTLAYDWYLFGHQYPERLAAKENILCFCFEFLDQIADEDYVEKGREKRERHPSNASSASEFDHLSIGSVDSVSSLPPSSSVTPSKTLVVPSVKVLPPVPTHLKVSPIKPPTESTRWPFEKAKVFSFDGISERECSENVAPGREKSGVVFPKQSSPIRSPLRERNKCSPKSSPSQKSGGMGRKSFNGLLRELTGSRLRKISVTESSNSKELDRSNTSEPEKAGAEDSQYPQIMASKPVPVPGARARLSSSDSSVSDRWLYLPSSARDDSLNLVSWECVSGKSDSFKTENFELEPISCATAGQERIHKREHLIKIKDCFMDMVREEKAPPSLIENISLQATQMMKSTRDTIS